MSALYFDLEEKKKLFPDSADSLIVDMYLSDNPQGSVRFVSISKCLSIIISNVMRC